MQQRYALLFLVTLAILALASCGGGGIESDPGDLLRPEFGPDGFLEERTRPIDSFDVAIHPHGCGLSAVFEAVDANARNVEVRLLRGGTFGPPESIHTSTRDLTGQSLASAGGNAAVVLQEPAGPSRDVSLLYYDDVAGAWRSQVLLEADIEWDSEVARGAMDAVGNVVVATVEVSTASQANRVSARRYTSSGTLEAVQIFDQNTGDTTGLRIAMNEQGVAVVAWTQFVASVPSVFAAVYEPGLGWSAPTEIDSVVDPTFVRGVNVAPDGHATVLLATKEGVDNFSRRMRMAVYMPPGAPNAGWSPSFPLQVDTGNLSDQLLLMAAGGQSVIVYATEKDPTGAGVVRVVRYAPSEGLGSTVQLAGPLAPAIDDTHMDAAVNANGDVVVAWTEGRSADRMVLLGALVSRDGQVQTGRELRDLPIANNLSSPSIAVDALGGGTIVWKELDPEAGGTQSRRHVARRIAPGGMVSTPVILAASPGNRSSNPRVEMSDDGLGMVFWLQTDTDTNHHDARFRGFR